MKRIISVLMIMVLLSGCCTAMAEKNLAIGREYADTAKTNAEMLAFIYSLDPDGFSTDMTDLLYHYTIMYISALSTETAERKLATDDGSLAQLEGLDYSRTKVLALILEKYVAQYKEWLDGRITNREFADFVIKILDIGESDDSASLPSPSPTPKNMKIGLTGSEAVRAVQRRLKQLGFFEGTADGNFDSETEKAVIAFQTANGLVPDGEVDEKTLFTLNRDDVITPDSVLYYNPEGGAYYHRDQNCKRIHVKFLPLKGSFKYAEIGNVPYSSLKPCIVCCNPNNEE